MGNVGLDDVLPACDRHRVRQAVLPPDHPDLAVSLENYAAMLRETGRPDEAEELEARARAIRAKHAERNPAAQ